MIFSKLSRLKISKIATAAFVFGALFAITPSNAGVIYNNGAPDVTNALYISGAINGTGLTTADDFNLTSSASIGSVGFYFQNYNGITGWNNSISYAFRSDAAGLPGAILATGSGQNVNALLSAFPWCCGGNAWLVTFDLQASFAATGGTDYWLELGGAGGPSPWWVVTGSRTGSEAWFLFNKSNIQNTGYDAAFYLVGTNAKAVPEPASLTLLGSGLLGLSTMRSRKNKKKTA